MIAKVKKPKRLVIAPAAVAKTVTEAQILSNGETKTIGAWKIEAVPMYNLKRGPSAGKFYHDKGRGNGYIVTYGGLRIYIAGDTEGIPEMRALKNIDVAFVPMNLPYTMTPEEAADAVKAFHPKVSIPITTWARIRSFSRPRSPEPGSTSGFAIGINRTGIHAPRLVI